MTAGARGLTRVLPALLARRFDPGAATGLDAAFELRVGTTPIAIDVSGGRCQVRRGESQQAGARLELSPRDLVSLALGSASWPQLLSAGRLRMSGDPFLALRFPPLFRLRSR